MYLEILNNRSTWNTKTKKMSNLITAIEHMTSAINHLCVEITKAKNAEKMWLIEKKIREISQTKKELLNVVSDDFDGF